jgi:5'-3' exonuclease
MLSKRFLLVLTLFVAGRCDTIATWHAGIGPNKAMQLLKKHGSLEGVLSNLDKDKYVPHSVATNSSPI